MNSLASSYPHPTHPHSVDQRQQKHHPYDTKSVPPSFFAPLLSWLLVLSIALAIILVMLFCTRPMTLQTLISDFWSGVEGVKVIF